MKNLVINYDILNSQINKNIVLLSDLHDYPGHRKSTLVEDIKILNPDFVVIAGDILNGSKFKIGNESLENLKRFLEKLSKDRLVFLGLGNHDLYTRQSMMEGYKDLATENIIPLSNEVYKGDDYQIVEFHSRHSAFSPSTQESGHALLQFLEDFENQFPNVSFDGTCSILISHNPKIIAQACSLETQKKLKISEREIERLTQVRETISKFNVVLSGHLHNGYHKVTTTSNNPSKYMDEGYWEMPIEKSIEGKVTTFRPWVLKKTDMCRGTIFVGNSEDRIIELSNGKYYYKNSNETDPVEISIKMAQEIITIRGMIPVVISGGVNKFFNFPIDKSEITSVRLLKK